MKSAEQSPPAPSAPAPEPSATFSIEHPARADDRDHGKVAMGYEGYRLPLWVVLPWILFLAWGGAYLVLYLLPVATGPH
jgi:hypothetical protein